MLCQGIYIHILQWFLYMYLMYVYTSMACIYLKAFSLAHNQLTVHGYIHEHCILLGVWAQSCVLIIIISSIVFISSWTVPLLYQGLLTRSKQPHCVAELNEDGVFSFHVLPPGQHSHWSVSLQQSGRQNSMYIGDI